MNQELADYDMCKLRIRDLEYKILKWQSNVKNIIDNPIISNTNKLLTYKKKNYLTEIMNKLTIEIVNKTTKDEVEIINYQCVKLINKMKKLRDKFIYTNQKIIENIIDEENDIVINKQIIENLKNKEIYHRDLTLFRRIIPRNFLNKIIYDGHDIIGLNDNDEKNITEKNYKKLLIISEYLCDAGLRKVTLWLRAEIARKLYNFKNFNNQNERYYYTYVIHDYNVKLEDYLKNKR